MANIGQFLLTSLVEHEIDLGWYIIETHLDIVGLPEFLLTLIPNSVSLAKSWGSVIAEPYIISLVDKSEGRG